MFPLVAIQLEGAVTITFFEILKISFIEVNITTRETRNKVLLDAYAQLLDGHVIYKSVG